MYRVLAGLAAVTALGLFILQAFAWKKELKLAKEEVAAYKEAAAMLDQHLAFREEENQKWQTAKEIVKKQEGANEPLNAYERAVLDCVRGQGLCNP